MALLIQKYGGTSVGSVERIQAVAERVRCAHQQGHQVIVVLSAMGAETDRLINLAKQTSSNPTLREYDHLLSTGEIVSASLLSMALNQIGCSSQSFNAIQAGIITNDHHTKARIQKINTTQLEDSLKANVIPVVAGFQGTTNSGDVTTLGRGGSDTTAVALAVALSADECQIYTDVDGVYTTDPRMVPEARQLQRITFEEMLELASLGAKVLQIRAVEFASKYNIPIRVLSSFSKGSGTLITYEDKRMEQPLISGIASNRNQAKISLLSVPDRPGVARHILAPISDANIDVDVIVQNVPSLNNTIDFTFTIQRDDYKKTMALIKTVAQQLDAKGVKGDEKIAKLSVVGVGMRSHPGVASTVFTALSQEGINIQLISTSEIKISVVIEEKYLELGARTLHQAFNLA